jgi:hypothetical protein
MMPGKAQVVISIKMISRNGNRRILRNFGSLIILIHLDYAGN